MISKKKKKKVTAALLCLNTQSQHLWLLVCNSEDEYLYSEWIQFPASNSEVIFSPEFDQYEGKS